MTRDNTITSVRLTLALSCAAGPVWLRPRGTLAAAINEQPNCGQRAAAPVLFGPGAWGAGPKPGRDSFCAKLCGRTQHSPLLRAARAPNRAGRGACVAEGPLRSVRLEFSGLRLPTKTVNLRALPVRRSDGWAAGFRRTMMPDALASGSAATVGASRRKRTSAYVVWRVRATSAQ